MIAHRCDVRGSRMPGPEALHGSAFRLRIPAHGHRFEKSERSTGLGKIAGAHAVQMLLEYACAPEELLCSVAFGKSLHAGLF
jgi:hypothetical protein